MSESISSGRPRGWQEGILTPNTLAKMLLLGDGYVMEIEVTNGKMPQEESLETLLKSVTDENIHMEIDFGKPEGKEIW